MALLTLENNVEDHLKDIQIENFDESMSFMDCAYYIVAEGERMWNDIVKEMAIEELRYLSENGVEMVYEAVDKSKKEYDVVFARECNSLINEARRVSVALINSVLSEYKSIVSTSAGLYKAASKYAKKQSKDNQNKEDQSLEDHYIDTDYLSAIKEATEYEFNICIEDLI